MNALKKASRDKHREWLVYPAIFAALLFISWFGVYLFYFGTKYLKLPSFVPFLNTTLILIATVVFEEVIARAFLTNLLLNLWGNKKSTANYIVVFCGILFGALHFFNYGVFNYLSVTQSLFASFLGIYLCLAYVMTNSIFETILIHTLFNFSSYLILLAFNTGAFPANVLAVVSNIVFTIIFILSVPLLILSVRRMKTQNTK